MTNIFHSNLFSFNWQYYAIGLFLYLFVCIISYLKTKYKHNPGVNFVSSDTEEEHDHIKHNESHYWHAGESCQHTRFNYTKIPEDESIAKSKEFYELMNMRRTVRHFSNEPISSDVINNIIKTAGTSPSGAHTEPWKFVIIKSQEMKEKLRELVEREEEMNYKRRMGQAWVDDLKFLRTYWIKEYLTDAPCLILVFKQTYSVVNGKKQTHYYNDQSTHIAAGILLTAIHYAGLVALTSTPLNCGPSIRKLLNRPPEEKLVLLFPVGYPIKGCLVPDISRKPLEDIMIEL